MSSSVSCINFPALAISSQLNEEEIIGPLSSKKVDYSMPSTWQEKARAITLLVLKILILPWGLIEGVRYLLGRVAMMLLYPAQSALIKKIYSSFRAEYVDALRVKALQNLAKNGYAARHVVLEKAGVRYSGLLVAHSETINSGHWVLQAGGNTMLAEGSIEGLAHHYRNVLIINGPSVGRSEGVALPAHMGDAQDVGLSFLEEVLKAKRIAFAGLSLGAAAQTKAIMQHTFKASCQYLMIRQMAFDTVSNVAYEFVKERKRSLFWGYLAAGIVHFCGLQIDSVEGSKRLRDLNIQEVVFQSCSDDTPSFQGDGIIAAPSTLGAALVARNISAEIIPLINADHNSPDIFRLTARRIQAFMAA